MSNKCAYHHHFISLAVMNSFSSLRGQQYYKVCGINFSCEEGGTVRASPPFVRKDSCAFRPFCAYYTKHLPTQVLNPQMAKWSIKTHAGARLGEYSVSGCELLLLLCIQRIGTNLGEKYVGCRTCLLSHMVGTAEPWFFWSFLRKMMAKACLLALLRKIPWGFEHGDLVLH